ncbi:MAG: formate dehydrogenase subunit gamma [Rhodospirillales bacterium]|nr:MAG: formate dehydrogenase subunit gamma [Rhodospirillales bacterium]
MRNFDRLATRGGRLGRVAAIALIVCATIFAASGFDAPGIAQESGQVPGEALGSASDSEFWRQLRGGAEGTVSIPDKNAGRLIQSEGELWRNWRNGPLSNLGILLLVATVMITAAFFAVRGRIKIDAGRSGRLIERFNGLERFTHWLTAGTFVVLAITGLNIMYGRYLFGGQPGVSGEFGSLHTFFAALTAYGKMAHNFLAFAFMLGLVLTFVLWVRHNIPNRHDLKWLAVAGGLFNKNIHPPAKKFNAGQKLLFWVVILGGLSMSLSGIALMFPFTFEMFSKTFAVLNIFGLGLPTDLSANEEMQLSQLWHALVSLVMIAIIVGHIYIGTIGMEGAFDAMGSGMVDENWAREHHGLWVAEMKGEASPSDHDDSVAASPADPPDKGAPQRA